MSVASGATLQAGSGGTGSVAINGGTLTGNGSVEGHVTGAGTTVPGRQTGPLTVSGTYQPAGGGALVIGISGPSAPGTDFGQLAVSGSASLNGSLNVVTASGYSPPLCDVYPVVTASSLSGTFGSLNGLSLADRQYRVTYGPTGVNLTVVGPPSVTSASSTTFETGHSGSFTVNTSGCAGFPATLSETGALPSGVTFVDNGDGTATLAGTPAAGTGGSYPLQITASNGVSPDATQSFVLTVDEPPTITSANSTTFETNQAGSFTVDTSGYPAPALSETGALPSGVTFVDNGDGTATLAGTPAAGTGGSYPLQITASNGVSPDAVQSFVLTVDEPPTITSANSATIETNQSGSFTVDTSGYPLVALSETGALPSGVTFVDNGDGTATLAGTPAAGTGGSYPLQITASNGVSPDAVQSFVLTVDQPPAITSANSATFETNQSGSFTVNSSGYPVAALSQTGTLPSGVTFVDNGDGTATLAGTPAAGTGETYPLRITASNGVSPDAVQSFVLTVDQPPAITSENSATFVNGETNSFTVTATGFPAPTFSEIGALPTGVTLSSGGVLSGTPSQLGSFPITVTATNGVSPDASQSFLLTVNQSGTPPTITSANNATFMQGQPGTFTMSATGSPPPTFSETGALPSGITLTSAGVLSGTTDRRGVFLHDQSQQRRVARRNPVVQLDGHHAVPDLDLLAAAHDPRSDLCPGAAPHDRAGTGSDVEVEEGRNLAEGAQAHLGRRPVGYAECQAGGRHEPARPREGHRDGDHEER